MTGEFGNDVMDPRQLVRIFAHEIVDAGNIDKVLIKIEKHGYDEGR